MKNLFWIWLALALPMIASAGVEGVRSLGDEDPFPLSCIDFSGNWRSDQGEELHITQGGQCRWLKVSADLDSNGGVVTIVPDDQARSIAGLRWKGSIRHRWNNKKFATVIETHRILKFTDRVVTELVLLEKVNNNLLLESTFRKTEPRGSNGGGGNSGAEEPCPEQEHFQRVFRLQSPEGGRR